MLDTRSKKKSKKPLMIAMLGVVVFLLLLTGFFVALEVSESFRNTVKNRFNGKQTGGTTIATPTPMPGDAASQSGADNNLVTSVRSLSSRSFLLHLSGCTELSRVPFLFSFSVLLVLVHSR